MTERNERVEALLAKWVLGFYRQKEVGHLAECPDTIVGNCEVYDSTYGCDTGCDYLRVEATLTCPHGHSVHWEDGDFVELADVIAEMEALDEKAGG